MRVKGNKWRRREAIVHFAAYAESKPNIVPLFADNLGYGERAKVWLWDQACRGAREGTPAER